MVVCSKGLKTIFSHLQFTRMCIRFIKVILLITCQSQHVDIIFPLLWRIKLCLLTRSCLTSNMASTRQSLDPNPCLNGPGYSHPLPWQFRAFHYEWVEATRWAICPRSKPRRCVSSTKTTRSRDTCPGRLEEAGSCVPQDRAGGKTGLTWSTRAAGLFVSELTDP